jgi:ABC-2 type transport system ATP-binding protein
MSSNVESAITTAGLTKRYGDRLAVDSLDLEVRRGEVFGLLGPNGAGKTTTVLMLLGLCEPTAGTAEVLGMDPTRQPLDVKARVGYLPDAVGFYGHLTGRQNLRYTTRLNDIEPTLAEQRIDDVLTQVGLTDAADRRTEQYSRGMLQRLGIADALVKDPEVLILDEPTIAIDPQGVVELLELIRRLRDERGVSVLLSSHLLHQVQAVCDRVAIFVAGNVVARGTVAELAAELSGGRQTVEIAVDGDLDRAGEVVRQQLTDAEVARDDGLLIVTSSGDPRARLTTALVGAALPVTHLRVRSSELDDIYTRYFAAASTRSVTDGDGADRPPDGDAADPPRSTERDGPQVSPGDPQEQTPRRRDDDDGRHLAGVR